MEGVAPQEKERDRGEHLMGLGQWAEQFNPPMPGWEIVGGAGFDQGDKFSRPGKPGNGWVRATQGWNAIQNWVAVPPNTDVTVDAWLRWAPALTGGYMSVRGDDGNGAPGPVITELRLAGNQPLPKDNEAGYFEYQFHFNSGPHSRVLFYVGLWGNGDDAWIQVDSAVLQWSTPY